MHNYDRMIFTVDNEHFLGFFFLKFDVIFVQNDVFWRAIANDCGEILAIKFRLHLCSAIYQICQVILITNP
jgi:hypothetical protein